MTNPSHGSIETISNLTNAPAQGRTIEVVFRTVGERTSAKALELVFKNIRPSFVHIVKDYTPFTNTVEQMLHIKHECSHVVYVDADCLILEDLRPFLDANDLPFVDAYVMDRFRGRVTCGVHVTRLDVVKRMQKNIGRFDHDIEFVLRPESYLRNVALAELGFSVQLKNFNILHDFLQFHTDLFIKYVVRFLRSKNDGKHISGTLRRGIKGSADDYTVVEAALQFASHNFVHSMKQEEIQNFLLELPHVAKAHIGRLSLAQQYDITQDEFESLVHETHHYFPMKNKPKVFGIGLSRTGTLSLTIALHELGFDTVHYPTDEETLDAIQHNDAHFPLLQHYDGITDITTIPYYKKLDTLYPKSKFILTVRDEASWLRSCRIHWNKVCTKTKQSAHKEEIKKELRLRVYGSDSFDAERFLAVYRKHLDDVQTYFKGREDDLLVLNIVGGEGYAQLADFLEVAKPGRVFPHRNISTQKISPEHKWDTLVAGHPAQQTNTMDV